MLFFTADSLIYEIVESKKVLITTTFVFRLDLDADCVEEVLDCASQLQVYDDSYP
jgi:hypothetical protein